MQLSRVPPEWAQQHENSSEQQQRQRQQLHEGEQAVVDQQHQADKDSPQQQSQPKRAAGAARGAQMQPDKSAGKRLRPAPRAQRASPASDSTTPQTQQVSAAMTSASASPADTHTHSITSSEEKRLQGSHDPESGGAQSATNTSAATNTGAGASTDSTGATDTTDPLALQLEGLQRAAAAQGGLGSLGAVKEQSIRIALARRRNRTAASASGMQPHSQQHSQHQSQHQIEGVTEGVQQQGQGAQEQQQAEFQGYPPSALSSLDDVVREAHALQRALEAATKGGFVCLCCSMAKEAA